MVVTRKEKTQRKRQLNQLNETFNDFVIGNKLNVSAKRNKILEPQANGCYINAERLIVAENSARQNQVIENILMTKLEKLLMMLLCVSKIACTTRF